MATPPAPPPPTALAVSISGQARLGQKMREVQRVYATLRPQIQWIQKHVEATADDIGIHQSRIAEAAEYIKKKTEYMNDQIAVEKSKVARLAHTQELYDEALEVFQDEIEEAQQDLDDELPLDSTKTEELMNKIIQFAEPLGILAQLKIQLNEDGTDTLLENHKKVIENIRQRYYRLRENVGVAMAQFCVEALDKFGTDLEAYNNKEMKELCAHVERECIQGFETLQESLDRFFDVAGTFSSALKAVFGDVDYDKYNTERARARPVEDRGEDQDEEVGHLQDRVLVQDPFLNAAISDEGRPKPLFEWAQFVLVQQPIFTRESPYLIVNDTNSLVPPGHALYFHRSGTNLVLVSPLQTGEPSIRILDIVKVHAVNGAKVTERCLDFDGGICGRLVLSGTAGSRPQGTLFWTTIALLEKARGEE